MSEKTKEDQLKEKLVDFFDKKLSDLTTKFTEDIDKIESYKNDYFDSVIKIYREIQEEQKQNEEQEKLEKEKEKEKKTEEPKHEKINKKKINNNNNRERPKTPLGTKRNKEKEKEKENKHDTTEIHNNKDKKKLTINTIGGGSKAGKGRVPTEASKRPVTGKGEVKSKTQIGKRPAMNNKKEKKVKGKKDTKKEEPKVEPKAEQKEEPKIEEKKPVVINPKYIITIPEEMKNNNITTIYFVLKKNYLDKKNILCITTSNSLLYKNFGNNMKFLLDEKKNEIQKKADEIKSFLNNYGDLNTYLTKEFSLTKKAMSSLSMFKKKEEEEVLKNQELPDEVGRILKCLCYLLDEKFDENFNAKELFENMLKNILEKNEDKTFKGLLVNYFNKNKFLNLTQEKAENINKIINGNNNILNMIMITKMCRPISLFCFLLKEVYDYINLKTSDGHYYYELRAKNKQLQEYLDFIYLYDNNGKERNPPKEEKKEEIKEETVEKTEEQNKVEVKEETKEEIKKETKDETKEENNEKKEEIKTEETKVEEESVKKEEENKEQNEQPPQE